METAENSILLERPLKETLSVWLEWTGQAPSDSAEQGDANLPVPDEQIAKHELQGEEGTISFQDLGGGSTRATMQLSYNPRTQADAGVDRELVAARIDQYLRRFKHAAEA